MSLVVADPLPLHYLVFCRVADVLPGLFDSVVIPQCVSNDLQQSGAPPMVRHWLETAPPWLSVQSPKHLDPTVGLESGDIEAISLAAELKAAAILSDDHVVRAAAARRGLSAVGTLGILELASYNGFLDFQNVIATLRQTHARFDPELMTLALDRAAANGKKSPTV